jgi:hypothetical protein
MDCLFESCKESYQNTYPEKITYCCRSGLSTAYNGGKAIYCDFNI